MRLLRAAGYGVSHPPHPYPRIREFPRCTASTRMKWRITRMAPMSYLLYDALLPHLGADAAEHWATTLVVNPI